MRVGRIGMVFAMAGVLGTAAAGSARAAVARGRAAIIHPHAVGDRPRTAPLHRRGDVSRPPADSHDGRPGRWQVVTVDRSPEEVLAVSARPEPLRRLGGGVEVTVRPAPGGRGTELAARPVPGAAWPGLAAHLLGDDSALLVRRTLWQVKQLVEAGEQLRADRPPDERAANQPGDSWLPPADRPAR
ncbi:hypothetical protein [Micromonospora sp. LOL_024]|uniref:hypothetical protein n=1 Tax=Micromonospora sp. LOL_024 TaxID=3345412 RepID=UPI003A8835D6